MVSRGGGEMAAVSGKKRRWPWMASLGSDEGNGGAVAGDDTVERMGAFNYLPLVCLMICY